MKMPDIQISSSNSFIELQALMAERDGMVAENMFRERCGNSIAYAEDAFLIIANKMRALKIVEGLPNSNQQTNATDDPSAHA
jgi:hypothetical protein